MRCVNPVYEHVPYYLGGMLLAWNAIHLLAVLFSQRGAVARTLNHCTALSETSKYTLEFLENAFFSDILHINYASYNLHVG